MIGVLASNAAVASSLASPSVHPHRGFVHIVIVDNLTAQHPRARVALAEQRRRVAPEVAAVRNHAPGEGVAGTSGLRAIAKAILGGGPEGIHAEEGRPLREAAVFAAGCWGCLLYTSDAADEMD